MQTTVLRIGTRGSALALAQASETRARLMRAHGLPEEAFAIEAITTSGDRIQDRPLSEAGGKGLFTKELEEALLDGRVDIAVHSSKDMPTVLPEGAVVGSSSLRRQALLKRMRPDLEVVTFRGNVQTRLRKLGEGRAEGTILALAGLRRLGLAEVASEILPLDTFPPAPGQGAICVESRIGDERVMALLAAIDHGPTHAALSCERAFLATLDGSCRTPIAGHATLDGDKLSFNGRILTPDGREFHDIADEGPAGEAVRAKAGPRFFESW